MDVGTGVALLGPSAITLKLLGPTADYVGEGVQSWAEVRVRNVRGIFGKAETKVTVDELTDGNSVSPRVLRAILDDGSFMEDELGQDYLGGVLAASHSEGGRDDRGTTYIDLLARLSSYQIRMHYVLYRAAQELCREQPSVNLAQVADREQLGPLFVPFPTLFSAMALSDDEFDSVAALLSHALVGLHREGLIERSWRYSTDPTELRAALMTDRDIPSGGLVFSLAMFGIELFCAAHGLRSEPTAAFLNARLAFVSRMTTEVRRCPAKRLLSFPPQPLLT